jgi:hypothetical protein
MEKKSYNEIRILCILLNKKKHQIMMNKLVFLKIQEKIIRLLNGNIWFQNNVVIFYE